MSAPLSSTFTSGGSVEEVFGILTSEQWVAVKAAELHDGSFISRRDEQGDGGVLLAISRALPDGVPGFLQKFLPSDGRVLETFDWAGPEGGARRGTWKVEIPGAPATLGGALRLDPGTSTGPAGSTYTIEGEVKVKIPLIGGKAEAFLADMAQRLASKEAGLLAAQVGP